MKNVVTVIVRDGRVERIVADSETVAVVLDDNIDLVMPSEIYSFKGLEFDCLADARNAEVNPEFNDDIVKEFIEQLS